jgi:hypothetical protein
VHVISLGFQTDLMVRALEGSEAAIRIYRSVGFADHKTQLSVHSAPS